VLEEARHFLRADVDADELQAAVASRTGQDVQAETLCFVSAAHAA